MLNAPISGTRRSVLATLALGAAAASAGCASIGRPDPAAAWRDPGAGERDPRRFALAHAILAPNSHNRQPWLVELVGEDGITLYFDTARRLPETDPFDRQCAISCGTFLELLAIAAAERGLVAEIAPFPEGAGEAALDARPVAHVRFTPGAVADPLFAHLTARRSHKEAYDPKRAVAPETLAGLVAGGGALTLGGALRGDPVAEELRRLVPLAYRREVETPATLKESIDLMRIGRAEIARHRDGIDLDFPGAGVMQALGLLTREQMLTPGTAAYRQGLEMYDPLAATAAGFVWIIAANDRSTQLAVGRRYARLNLEATARGLAMHPMSQGLQEYPEMADIKAQMDAAAAVPTGQTLQMLARIGYAEPVPPAPRRGLAEHWRA